MTFFDFRKRVKNGVAILLLLFWPPTRGVGYGRYLRHPLLHWLCPQRRGLGVSFAFLDCRYLPILIYITESTELWFQLRCKVFPISALSKPYVEIKRMSPYHCVQISTRRRMRLECMCWQQTVSNRYIIIQVDVGYFHFIMPMIRSSPHKLELIYLN